MLFKKPRKEVAGPQPKEPERLVVKEIMPLPTLPDPIVFKTPKQIERSVPALSQLVASGTVQHSLAPCRIPAGYRDENVRLKASPCEDDFQPTFSAPEQALENESCRHNKVCHKSA
jgi:hypothetical protein